MEVKRQQRYLSLAAACLLALAAIVVIWSVSAIEESDQSIASGRRNPVIGLSELEPADQAHSAGMVTRPLRTPLYDPPAKPQPPPEPTKPPAPQPKPAPKLNLTLVGTIIEADQSLAIIADATGQFDVKGVGEALEISPAGIVIAEIEAEWVKLKYRGQSAQLQLERSKGKTKGNGGNRNNNRRRAER